MRIKLFLFLTAVSALNCFCMTPADIAKKYGDSVVTVNVLTDKGEADSGTGFIISTDGLIVTNKHVVNNAVLANVT